LIVHVEYVLSSQRRTGVLESPSPDKDSQQDSPPPAAVKAAAMSTQLKRNPPGVDEQLAAVEAFLREAFPAGRIRRCTLASRIWYAFAVEQRRGDPPTSVALRHDFLTETPRSEITGTLRDLGLDKALRAADLDTILLVRRSRPIRPWFQHNPLPAV
jgi:hypothetical protein